MKKIEIVFSVKEGVGWALSWLEEMLSHQQHKARPDRFKSDFGNKNQQDCKK